MASVRGVRWLVLCMAVSAASGIRVGRSAPSRELLDHTEIHNIETLKDIREFERQQRLALIKKVVKLTAFRWLTRGCAVQ